MSENNLLFKSLFLTQVVFTIRVTQSPGKCLGELQEVLLNCPAGQVVRCRGCHVKEPGSAFQMIGPLLVDCGEDCGWHPGGTYITLNQTMRNVVPFPFSFSPSNASQIGRKSLSTLTNPFNLPC